MLRSFLLGSILCSVVYTTSAQIPYHHAYFNQKRVNLLGKEKKDSIKWADPKKATVLALSIPGAGQIYNKKYWKAGVVYAGFGGLIYMFKYNTDSLNKYQNIYISKLDTSILDLAPNRSEASIKSDRDFHRRYRDISLLGFVGLYALQAIDANVDAHLKEFKVNKELSLKLTPEIYSTKHNMGYYNGFTLTMKF
ncbi:MAG: DUF5683 domain-containing protein [Bacteroidia bacterium]